MVAVAGDMLTGEGCGLIVTTTGAEATLTQLVAVLVTTTLYVPVETPVTV